MKLCRYLAAVFALAQVIFHQTPQVSAGQSTEPGLQSGDILVGAATEVVPYWVNPSGAIYRVRNGTAVKFCEADAQTYWNVPYELTVDSQGRVVFLASLGSKFFSGQNIGLLRCNAMGAPAERLAVFLNGSTPADWPNPFPGQSMWAVKGLHLSRMRAIKIIDDENGGKPQLTTVERYVLAFAPGNPGSSGNPDSSYQVWQYDPDRKEWARGQQIVDSGTNPKFDMVYEDGNTYSISENKLGRHTNGLNLDLEAQIGEFELGLQLNLFGGFNEVPVGTVVDDLSAANPPAGSNCAGSMPAEYGGFRPLHGLYNIVFDTFGPRGLMMSADFAGAHAVSSNWDERLINDDLSDDRFAFFQHPYFGCALAPFIGYYPLSNSLVALHSGSLAAAPMGPVAIAYNNGYLVRLRPNLEPETIADSVALPWAGGVTAYPSNVSPGKGITLVLRFDSPIDAMITTSDGRRLGVDAASGETINEFGDDGVVGAPGEPRFFALRNPPDGPYRVDTIGTGSGPYTVHVYAVDLQKPEGQHIKTTGTAQVGVAAVNTFVKEADGTIASEDFNGGIPEDTTPPVIVPVRSSPPNAAGWYQSPVTISWQVMDEESGIAEASGCEAQTVSADTASHTISCTATNGAGFASTVSVDVRIDTAPPTVVTSRAPLANAAGWNNTAVTVDFVCDDALSGVAAQPAALVFSIEGAEQGGTRTCSDEAGNTVMAEIGDVNIDTTPPTITASRTAPNASGWNTTAVTVTFTCVDGLSGVGSCSDSAIVSGEGGGQTSAGSALDLAGNVASVTVEGINIDLTPPAVSCVPTPTHIWPQKRNLVPVSVALVVTDALSGAGGFTLVRATSTDGAVPGDIQEFVVGTADVDGLLRADRRHGERGRAYLLTYEGVDVAGHAASCTAAIDVARLKTR